MPAAAISASDAASQRKAGGEQRQIEKRKKKNFKD
jgi:hypothetical protein